jgi:hypothetical protein
VIPRGAGPPERSHRQIDVLQVRLEPADPLLQARDVLAQQPDLAFHPLDRGVHPGDLVVHVLGVPADRLQMRREDRQHAQEVELGHRVGHQPAERRQRPPTVAKVAVAGLVVGQSVVH